MQKLNVDFVAETAEKLEPIFKFNSHYWGWEEREPTAKEIEAAIYELYASGEKHSFPIGTGGIWLDTDGNDWVIEYRQSIEFRWDKGAVYMA